MNYFSQTLPYQSQSVFQPQYQSMVQTMTPQQQSNVFLYTPPTYTKKTLNWKNIENLDVTDVIQKNDKITIEQYLNIFLDSTFSKEDFTKQNTETQLRLLQMLQLILQYFQWSDRTAETYILKKKQNIEEMETSIKLIKSQILNVKESIQNLHKKIEHKMEEQRRYIKFLREKPSFKCQFCVNKYFLTHMHIDEHIKKKHFEYLMPLIPKDAKAHPSLQNLVQNYIMEEKIGLAKLQQVHQQEQMALNGVETLIESEKPRTDNLQILQKIEELHAQAVKSTQQMKDKLEERMGRLEKMNLETKRKKLQNDSQIKQEIQILQKKLGQMMEKIDEFSQMKIAPTTTKLVTNQSNEDDEDDFKKQNKNLLSPEELENLIENQTKLEDLFNNSSPEERMSKEFIESPVIKNIVDIFVQKDIKITIIEVAIMEQKEIQEMTELIKDQQFSQINHMFEIIRHNKKRKEDIEKFISKAAKFNHEDSFDSGKNQNQNDQDNPNKLIQLPNKIMTELQNNYYLGNFDKDEDFYQAYNVTNSKPNYIFANQNPSKNQSDNPDDRIQAGQKVLMNKQLTHFSPSDDIKPQQGERKNDRSKTQILQQYEQQGRVVAEKDIVEFIEEPDKHVFHEGFIPHSIPKNF